MAAQDLFLALFTAVAGCAVVAVRALMAPDDIQHNPKVPTVGADELCPSLGTHGLHDVPKAVCGAYLHGKHGLRHQPCGKGEL